MHVFVDADGQLRWPWRLLAFAFFTVAAAYAITAIAYPIVAGVSHTIGVRFIAYPWIMAASVASGHALSLRFADRTMTWSAIGLGRPALGVRALSASALLGALAIAVPCVALLAIGWLTVSDSSGWIDGAGGLALPDQLNWWSAAGASALMLVPAALAEELLMRGYAFAVLRARFGWQVALGATSAIFALLHVDNPGASAQALALVTIAGIFLGTVLLVTGSLYAAVAAHFSWNFVMAALLHTTVSGLPVSAPGYRVVNSGPAWATGGPWGPEGGAFAALGMAMALVVLFTRPAGRALLMRPFGRGENVGHE